MFVQQNFQKPERVMLPEDRLKWTTALRSPEFKQGIRRLYTFEGTFCCLGVAANVIGNVPKDSLVGVSCLDKLFNTMDGRLPYYGLPTLTQLALSVVNDGARLDLIADQFRDAGYNTHPALHRVHERSDAQYWRADFNSIADWIDENL